MSSRTRFCSATRAQNNCCRNTLGSFLMSINNIRLVFQYQEGSGYNMKNQQATTKNKDLYVPKLHNFDRISTQLIFKGNQKYMLYLRTLLSPRSRSTQEAQVTSLLSKVGVTGRGELKEEYGSELLDTITKSLAPEKFMKALLDKLTELETPEEMAKMLAMIHCAICEAGYQGNVMEQLSNITLPQGFEAQGKIEDWFIPFYRAYVCYLVKLPSVAEVYARTRCDKEVWFDSATLLVDIFRLMNQLNLILTPMTSMFNTIGRYYLDKRKAYNPMYKLLRSELLLIYNYVQRAVDTLFESCESIAVEKLVVFLEAVPQMEVWVDRLQQFLMNKYFSGSKPSKKIYFRADQIAKIDYHFLKKTTK